MLELKVGEADTPMGWFEFISSMTGSLAWPVAAVIIALVFRSQIVSLMQRLREFGFGDAKATFSEQLDKAEQKAESLPPAIENAVLAQLEPEKENRFERLLAISPSAAVMDSWTDLERKLRDVAVRYAVETQKGPAVSVLSTVNALNKIGKLPMSVVTTINDLRRIRNVAAHSNEVAPSDALRFHEMAQRVNGVLDTYLD